MPCPISSRIDNVRDIKVGNIKATHAKGLAPILDQQLCRAEASIRKVQQSQWECPVRFEVYAAPERTAWAVGVLKSVGLYRAPDPVPAPSHQVSRVQGSRSQREVDDVLFSRQEAEAQLQFDAAALAPCVSSELLSHQEHGVAWMLGKERTDPQSLPMFFSRRLEMGREVYFNSLTCSSLHRKPEVVLGGIYPFF